MPKTGIPRSSRYISSGTFGAPADFLKRAAGRRKWTAHATAQQSWQANLINSSPSPSPSPSCSARSRSRSPSLGGRPTGWPACCALRAARAPARNARRPAASLAGRRVRLAAPGRPVTAARPRAINGSPTRDVAGSSLARSRPHPKGQDADTDSDEITYSAGARRHCEMSPHEPARKRPGRRSHLSALERSRSRPVSKIKRERCRNRQIKVQIERLKLNLASFGFGARSGFGRKKEWPRRRPVLPWPATRLNGKAGDGRRAPKLK